MYGEIFMGQPTAREQIGRMEEKIDQIFSWVESLHKTVNGNGQPGHEQRIRKLEVKAGFLAGMGTMSKVLWIVFIALIGIVVGIFIP